MRGFVVALFLGPPMFLSGAVAVLALLEVVVAGWIPSKWFSGDAADWWFAFGLKGGGSAYVRFMTGAIIAHVCYSVIAWGFNGRERPPSQR